MRVFAAFAALLAIAICADSSASALDDEVRYFQPFQYGDVWSVTCGNGMGPHMNGGNYHALDYDLPEGTPVCAAAAGEVVSVVEGNDGATGDAANNNEVAIRHANGRVTVYLHVKKDGVVVAKGDTVERGDLIAYSGNTGATSGPHLHFAVMERHGGASVAFRFADFGGSGLPTYGDRVTSFNFPLRFRESYDAIQAALRARDLARALECWEIAAKPLQAVAAVAMPMPLRVLEEALAQRDEALRERETAAIDALRALGEARATGDFARAARIAVHAKADFAGTGQSAALRTVLADLEKRPAWHATFEASKDEWSFRAKVLVAAREELAGRDAKSLVPLWRTALDAAPERLRMRVEAHLAVIEAGLVQGDVPYYQPFEWNDIRLVQTGNGSGHHADERNRYAFDYAMPIGSPVLASAPGVVVAVKEDTLGPTGRDADDNLVAIRHADGMVSVYRHLAFQSVAVDVGSSVGRGDFLAFSGDTGNADAAHPHLHFGLQRSVAGASVPLRFADFGNSGVPNQGDLVTSFNFPARCHESNIAMMRAARVYDLATRFGCIEPGGRRLAAVRDIHCDMPLRSVAEPIRIRDRAWADYERRAAAALALVADAKSEFSDRVRAAVFGSDDFVVASLAPQFDAALAELRIDSRFAAAASALDEEREYRRQIEFAIRSDVEGRDDRAAVLTRYRLALRRAPAAHREALVSYVDAMAASPGK